MIVTQFLASLAAAVFLTVFALAASYSDVTKRIVPNKLNLAAFQTSSLLYFAWADVSVSTVIGYGAFVLAVFLFSLLLYQLGAWAGGDAKYFTSLLSFYPIFHDPSLLFVPAVFLFSAAMFLPVLALLHWKKILGLREEFFEAGRLAAHSSLLVAPASSAFMVFSDKFYSAALGLFQSALYAAAISVGLVLAYSALGKKVPSFLLALLFVPALAINFNLALFGLAFSFFFAFCVSFLVSSFGIVSSKILTFEVPAAKLEEGMIPAETVFVEGGKVRTWRPGVPDISKLFKALPAHAVSGSVSEVSRRLLDFPRGTIVADALKARGLSKEEISELKKFKVHGVKVKESVAFAPMLSAGFAAGLLLLP